MVDQNPPVSLLFTKWRLELEPATGSSPCFYQCTVSLLPPVEFRTTEFRRPHRSVALSTVSSENSVRKSGGGEGTAQGMASQAASSFNGNMKA